MFLFYFSGTCRHVFCCKTDALSSLGARFILTLMQCSPSCGSLCTFTFRAYFFLHTCLAGISMLFRVAHSESAPVVSDEVPPQLHSRRMFLFAVVLPPHTGIMSYFPVFCSSLLPDVLPSWCLTFEAVLCFLDLLSFPPFLICFISPSGYSTCLMTLKI